MNGDQGASAFPEGISFRDRAVSPFEKEAL